MTPRTFGKVVSSQIHHFSDASIKGYGTVSYLRQEDENGKVHCCILLGKSRLAPLKTISIPRLELSAAVLAVNTDKLLRNELDISLDESVYWTDSMLVLQYINNKDKRFQTFVANRVATIHSGSSPAQWYHVSSAQNPADQASRGLSADELSSAELWWSGPEFLLKDTHHWPETPVVGELTTDDPEVKRDAQTYTQ